MSFCLKTLQTKITTHNNNAHLYPIADAVLWLWWSGWLELKLMVELLEKKWKQDFLIEQGLAPLIFVEGEVEEQHVYGGTEKEADKGDWSGSGGFYISQKKRLE